MKKVRIAGWFMLWLLSVTSCQKDRVAQVMRHGKWEVQTFSENGIDETAEFKNYVFKFEKDGIVTAGLSNATYAGRWGTGSDYRHNDIFLDFGSNIPFNELNETWHVLENSGQQVKLRNANDGQGGTDMLTFRKI